MRCCLLIPFTCYVQEEGNRRTLEPWRTYLLTPSWFQQRRRVRQLNEYIIGALRRSQRAVEQRSGRVTGMLRARWQRRQAGEKPVRCCVAFAHVHELLI